MGEAAAGTGGDCCTAGGRTYDRELDGLLERVRVRVMDAVHEFDSVDDGV